MMIDTYYVRLDAEFVNEDDDDEKPEDYKEVVDKVLNATWKISIERTEEYINPEDDDPEISLTLYVTAELLTELPNLSIIQYAFEVFEDDNDNGILIRPDIGINALTMNQFKLSGFSDRLNFNYRKLKVSIFIYLQEKPNFSVDYGKMLQNKTFADFTIKCKMGDKEFKIHKLVLAARSPVFYSMFDSDFEEAKSNIVEIQDIDSEIMEILLTYIYNGKLTETHRWFDLYVAADKYQIEDLMNHCIRYLMANMDASNLIDALKIGKIFEKTKLTKNSLSYIVENSSDSSIRMLTQSNAWENFLHDYPNITKDIIQYQLETIEEIKRKGKN